MFLILSMTPPHSPPLILFHASIPHSPQPTAHTPHRALVELPSIHSAACAGAGAISVKDNKQARCPSASQDSIFSI